MFERKGIFRIIEENIKMDVEEFALELMDGGLDEYEIEDGFFTASCAFEDFGSLNSKLEELGVDAESSNIEMVPTTTKELSVDHAKSVLKMIDKLEDDDDVQNVFHNLEMTDDLAAALAE
jgi:transcriptional/translational regulatory protein YebC/TACO1